MAAAMATAHGIHDAKDGFPIGSYFNGQKVLDVAKLDNTNYSVTVTVPNDGSTASAESLI